MIFPEQKAMAVAGIMSGTSADGIDVALCRIGPAKDGPKLKLLAHRAFPYTAEVRAAVLAAMNAKRTSVAEIAQLNWRLSSLYADAVESTLQSARLKAALVALHGQTIYHQSTSSPFLGAPTRTTWQLGEASVLSERLRLPVVSDFRPADLAAGGQGAPLVPMLDYTLFRHATRNRVLLNLGGIGNLTALPAGGSTSSILAFDTGPANMVLDALMHTLLGRNFDSGGQTAARGKVLAPVLRKFLALPYFAAPPPKSCGREEWGATFTKRFLTACKGAKNADVLATATALTAESVLDAYRRFVWPHLGQHAPLARGTDVIVAGGGALNATLMRSLRDGFAALGVTVKTTAETPQALPIEAKEAAAFALLGWLTWHGLPGNVPAATGAARPVILGKVSYA